MVFLFTGEKDQEEAEQMVEILREALAQFDVSINMKPLSRLPGTTERVFIQNKRVSETRAKTA